MSPDTSLSANDSLFLATVNEWINQQNELLVLIRYSDADGSKDFLLVDSFDEFREKLGRLSPKTGVTVFRQPQLPLRGVVDSALINTAVEEIPDGTQYLVLLIYDWKHGWSHWFAGDTSRDLTDDLEGWLGQRVAAGPYPKWREGDEDSISAIVPGLGGVVRVGTN